MGKHYEQLTAEERAAIMMMTANNCSVRQIAMRLRRAPSTITRELARFPAWPDRSAAVAYPPAQYDARAAGLRARRARFTCRKRSKVASYTVLFGVVQHFLARGWSPSPIAGTLKLMWPDEPQRTVSHESIHNCIYAIPAGELRKDLVACLRRAKSTRMSHSQSENPVYHVPVFVLTHHPRPPLVMEGGTTFHFVTDGIDAALARAREAAGGKDVRLGGGVSVIQQYLRERLVDEMHIAISPVLLGAGERLFDWVNLPALGYACTRHERSPLATHVVFTRQ